MLPDLYNLHNPAKRQSKTSENSITALIDVVFILLLFFMLAGQIKELSNPDILLPYSALGKTAEQQPLKIEISKDGGLIVNDKPLELAQLDSALADINSDDRIAVLADKRLKVDKLDEVLSVIRARGIAKVSLLSDGSSDGVEAP